MTELRLHNTLSGSKEVFTPINPNELTVYVCGPTVYDFVHIGNGRPAVVFDVLIRLLKAKYPRVTYARNVTDIDDKINATAIANGEPIQTLADRFTEAYENDMATLGVLAPDVAPRATHHIAEIVAMIGELVTQGHAYENEGHVLFNVPSDPDYGSLSRRSLEDMLDGARVEIAPYKRDAKDFVLWKPSEGNLPGWDSPWGYGRPGWHIECSAMIRKHLGKTIDIHGGGSDLTFPHHENEAAQSRCANGTPDYVRYWLHNGMLTMGGEKMSKSVGNVQKVRELAKRHSGEVLRYALLGGQYRSPLAWGDDVLRQAKASLDTLYQALRDNPDSEHQAPDYTTWRLDQFPQAAVNALCDDLNTPLAQSVLHEFAGRLQRGQDDEARSDLLAASWLLGLLDQDPETYFKGTAELEVSSQDIDALIMSRNNARAAKNYALADKVRDELIALGIELEDTREGTRWRRR